MPTSPGVGGTGDSSFESLRTDYDLPASKAKEVAKEVKGAAQEVVGAMAPVSARVGMDTRSDGLGRTVIPMIILLQPRRQLLQQRVAPCTKCKSEKSGASGN